MPNAAQIWPDLARSAQICPDLPDHGFETTIFHKKTITKNVADQKTCKVTIFTKFQKNTVYVTDRKTCKVTMFHEKMKKI